MSQLKCVAIFISTRLAVEINRLPAGLNYLILTSSVLGIPIRKPTNEMHFNVEVQMAKTDYVIRQGNPTDFDQIDIFDPFAGDRPKDIAEGRCIVAELNSQVIGYVVFEAAGFIGRPFVQFLAVAPDHRRCGIATILLQTVERRIVSGRLFISTEADNVPMKHLLAQAEWIAAGCVAGVNNNDVAECFFYRDIQS